MERDMRQQLFDHYEKLSFSYYDQNNSGQMMSKLVSDLFDISEFAHHGPENLFISLIKDYRIVCIFVSDQLETGNSTFGSGSVHVVFLLWTEQEDAGDIHGQPA